MSYAKNPLLGFAAAAIAVVTVHQAIVFGLNNAGMIKAAAWSFDPVPPYKVPRLLNAMFWGGLWGALFSLIWDKLPGAALWLKGLVYGLGVALVSNFLLVPFIKGQIFGQKDQVLFAGGDPKRMLSTLLILAGFGAATGAIYGLIAKR